MSGSSHGALEEAIQTVGSWGHLHWYLTALLALPVLLTGMYGTNYVFLARDIPHRCYIPECEALVPTSTWASWALVPNSTCHRWGSLDGQCTNSSYDYSTQLPCDQLVYQSSDSIVAEFNLGCQQWKRTLVGSIHNVGMLISLPLMGYVSDHWGRRTALVVSGFGAGLLGVLKSFASSYWWYITAELLETVLGASVYPAAFVLLIEWMGAQQRILTSLLLGVPLALGGACLAGLHRAVSGTGGWRLWARLAYPPSILLLLYPRLVPDSARWLATRGQMSQAWAALRWAARLNRVKLSEDAWQKMIVEDQDSKIEKQNLMKDSHENVENLANAIFSGGVVTRRLAVCGVWWMSAVFVFYGLAVRAGALAGDPHLNFALLASMELVALVLNTVLLDRVGRRPLLRASFLITGVACTSISLLPDSAKYWVIALYLTGKVGATMSLNCLYVYTAELFPTSARHRLLAACSTLGRIGSILAPLTPHLAEHRIWLPTLLFGSLPLLSVVLTVLVPETLRTNLPETIADLEQGTHVPL